MQCKNIEALNQCTCRNCIHILNKDLKFIFIRENYYMELEKSPHI